MAGRSLRASGIGIQKARTALKRKNLTQKAIATEIALAAWATVNKFFTGKAVDRSIFLEICQFLDLDWQEIAENSLGEGEIEAENAAQTGVESAIALSIALADDLAFALQRQATRTQQQVFLDASQAPVTDSPSTFPSRFLNFFALDDAWVGRENLIRELNQRIEESCRLLILVGIAGIGKTALGERLAVELEPWFDGDWNRFQQKNFDDEQQSSDFASVAASWLEKWGEGHPLALRVIAGEIKNKPFEGKVIAYWNKYGNEIEEVEKALAQAQEGKSTGAEDKWQLDRFTKTLRRNVRSRLNKTFARLKEDAKWAYILLCEASVYRCPVPEDFWLSHLEDWERNEDEQRAALDALRDRYLVEELVDSDHQCLLRQHNLVRSISLEHLKHL